MKNWNFASMANEKVFIPLFFCDFQIQESTLTVANITNTQTIVAQNQYPSQINVSGWSICGHFLLE